MLVAHVERDGVWLVQGGMYRLVEALARLAAERGVVVRCAASVATIEVARGRVAGVSLLDGERVAADAVVVNADPAALPLGFFGPDVARATPAVPREARSQSALTWAVTARADGFALSRHNVFFSEDYPAEFEDVFARGQPPESPTVYVCAQDRDEAEQAPGGAERLLCLINAPADGDRKTYAQTEMDRWTETMRQRLQASGLTLEPDAMGFLPTAPDQFATLFPGTGGALYGQAVHGATATFHRPGSKTRVPGLYLAGGATHPGAGVPMAALSGRLAAAQIIADGVLTRI
jgi:1-hydroxycarotenoid 3,4-desaturase